jgi:hypothetical protein
MHALVDRIHGHRGPQDGKRGDAVPVLREEGGALLQLLEIRAPVAFIWGRDHTIQRRHPTQCLCPVNSSDELARSGERSLGHFQGVTRDVHMRMCLQERREGGRPIHQDPRAVDDPRRQSARAVARAQLAHDRNQRAPVTDCFR